jgi:hypothetical protein
LVDFIWFGFPSNCRHKCRIASDSAYTFPASHKLTSPQVDDLISKMYTYKFPNKDHELFRLESPLKAQGLATEEIVVHIPCGPSHKEVYASMDWVDRYMTDMGTL